MLCPQPACPASRPLPSPHPGGAGAAGTVDRFLFLSAGHLLCVSRWECGREKTGPSATCWAPHTRPGRKGAGLRGVRAPRPASCRRAGGGGGGRGRGRPAERGVRGGRAVSRAGLAVMAVVAVIVSLIETIAMLPLTTVM